MTHRHAKTLFGTNKTFLEVKEIVTGTNKTLVARGKTAGAAVQPNNRDYNISRGNVTGRVAATPITNNE